MLNITISHSTPERLPVIIRLLMEARIGVDEGWTAEVIIQANQNERLLGCCALDFVGRMAVLHGLAVEKPMRRMGIGKKLVEYCIALAQERQAESVVTFTMFWNVNFFRKCGFHTTSRKLLPPMLKDNVLVCHPALRRATPMITQFTCRNEQV
jgi:N-acetylglutamate synthase-like GNAT family acetyltransferase